MHHPFMDAVAHSFAERRIATLRFQFPYMENSRGSVAISRAVQLDGHELGERGRVGLHGAALRG